MTKRNLSLWQFVGFSVVSLLGTLLHFLYDFSGEKWWTALISGVNESTWEHMKLLFVPLFFFGLVEYFFFPEYKNFWCVKLKGTLLGLALFPVIFYTYQGVLGKNVDAINILIFFISAAVAYLYEAYLFRTESLSCKSPKRAITILCVIAFCFVLFTFITPMLGIFEDPITGVYGI